MRVIYGGSYNVRLQPGGGSHRALQEMSGGTLRRALTFVTLPDQDGPLGRKGPLMHPCSGLNIVRTMRPYRPSWEEFLDLLQALARQTE